MDYAKAAAEVLKCIGGKENVISATHCATRLRLVIADNKKVVKAALEDVTGVLGVFEAQGQLQIIFGTGTVNNTMRLSPSPALWARAWPSVPPAIRSSLPATVPCPRSWGTPWD